MQVLGRRVGEEIFLIGYGEGSLRGFIYDLDSGVKYPDCNIQSVLLRGIWEKATPKEASDLLQVFSKGNDT